MRSARTTLLSESSGLLRFQAWSSRLHRSGTSGRRAVSAGRAMPWVGPARDGIGDELVLKVGWRHREAEHEADALRFWDGDGAVRCFKTLSLADRRRCCLSVACRESS